MPGGDRCQHAVAQFSLTAVVRGGRDVENERTAAAHQLLHRVDGIQAAGPEQLIVPGIFADGEGEALVRQGVELLTLSGSKIALLVENIVERQKPFGLDELHPAVAQQRSRIHHLFTRSGRSGGDVTADDCQRPAGGRGGGNLSNGLPGSCHKRRFVQKIGGRIAANRQLREQNDVCPRRRGLTRKVDDFLCIPQEIPNRGVDLSKSDLHFFSLATSRFLQTLSWLRMTGHGFNPRERSEWQVAASQCLGRI